MIQVLVWDYIRSKLKEKVLHFTLLDPYNQPPPEAGKMGRQAAEAGTDAIMVGGSTGVSTELFYSTVQAIKDQTSLPVILFPTSSESLCDNADAVFFMSLLNSQNIRFNTGEQLKGASFVNRTGLEAIPMGYIIIEPGMTVGKVGKADVVKRDKPETAINYALMAQYFGMSMVYLEAGSGAHEPVPAEMVRAVKNRIGIPLIIGGGIRTPTAASEVARAGADVIVTGTIVEDAIDKRSTLESIITSIRES